MAKNSKYEKNYLKEQLTISSIYTVHYFKYGKNFRVAPEKHNFWELIFIDSGNAKVVADNKTYSLTQGQAFLHHPNQTHTVYTEDKFANSAIVSFDCTCRSLSGINDKILEFTDYEKDLLTRILGEVKAGYHDKLNEVFLTKMTKKTSRPFGNDQIIKNCLELLLISLVRNAENYAEVTVDSPMEAFSGDTVKNIITILKSKLETAEQVSLDELSINLGFSKSYIKSLFKKKTGKSILQYFIDLKIDRAKKLLSQSKYTVTEIADMLGFNSVFYFSRQFKLHTDMSPTEYINSIKADNLL
ncbi:MAG: helix-turn-helix transcriptional regulator [Clostridia bacterium]|nr:helix-turn-helix transcriptional regulator [Clostridia bacterium]